MCRFTILALSFSTLALSTLALSACGTFKDGTDTKRVTDTIPAASIAASTTEQKEMAAMMGASAAPAAGDAASDTAAVDTVATTDTASEPEATATIPQPEKIAGIPSECPGVAVLPDTKSITYFDDPEGKPTGAMTARASMVDVKGGCDYTDTGVVVDIDMIMKGHIEDAGRYQGKRDLEAFMTFPYFVAIMDPDGKMIDKKIMATAMRFKPNEDDLDHAEKITQTIPLKDVKQGNKYTITIGFQLNRAQLDYNRGTVSAPASAVETPKADASTEPSAKAEESKDDDKTAEDVKAQDETKSDATPISDDAESEVSTPLAESAPAAETTPEAAKTEATPAAAPAPAIKNNAKMKPIL